MARYVALILPPGGPVAGAAARHSAAAGPAPDPALLGSKGAGLVRMAQLGLPVPPGFVLTTELWRQLYGPERGDDSGVLPEPVWREVEEALAIVEQAAGARLGDSACPLLLAVRSGATVSMPGMMTSVCNLGVSDQTVAGLARRLGDRRCALDCYRRFLQCYGTVVLGLRPTGMFDSDPLDALLFEYKQRRGILFDADFGEEDLTALCAAFKDEIRRRLGADAVPDDPRRQLRAAIDAVLRSWDSKRARDYRRLHDIPDALGTAVTIQAMVFGNLGGGSSGGSFGAGPTSGPGSNPGVERSPAVVTSAAGVAFTRDPSSGEPVLYGEFLPGAQGEDVVAGGHTPRPLGELATCMPAAYRELVAVAHTLEQQLGDMQDIEFTIEREKLWLLQTRTGKRSGRAMLKIACDLHREGRLSIEQALLRVEAGRLSELLHPTVDRQAPRIVLGRGLPASPGAATGRLVLSSEAAAELRRRGEAAILARVETSSDDIVGIQAAVGVLTARGGMTSHAAVVARGMGRSAVVGASALQIDYARQELRTREHVVRSGEVITIDGNSGEVLLGAVPLRTTHLLHNPDYGQLMGWADARATVGVLAEADTEVQAQLCRDLGLFGIGLSRSERLLCHPERAAALREVCERPQQDAAVLRLADALTPRYRALLAAAPPGPVLLRLLEPGAARALLAAADCELGDRERLLLSRALTAYRDGAPGGAAVVRALWQAQLRAVARAQLGEPAPAGRPLVLVPSSVALTETAALAELLRAARVSGAAPALQLGALLTGPDCVRCAELIPHLDLLGVAWDEPAAAARPDEPDRARRTTELAAAITSARAAAGSRELRLGLYAPDNLNAAGSEERLIERADRLGLDFVVCPPLRAPIARLLAAQVRLRAAASRRL
jgi:pyruvate,orthophosphate dikinase